LRVIAIDARLAGGTSTGDSTYWTGLLQGLSKIIDAERIVLLSSTSAPPGIPLDVFEWVRVPAKSSRWWSMVAFPLAARKLGARAIHTQYTLSPLVGNRGLTTIHDVSFMIGPEWFRPKDRLLLKASIPAAVRRARRVITVSETSRREIEKFMPFSKCKTVVTHLACPPWIQRVDRNVARVRASELGLGGPFALTVGTRWPRKNMSLAIGAVERVNPSGRLKLAVTGKYGWGPDELGTNAIATGYVSNEDLSCLYSAAELYLAPSRHEGFGIPVLEAFRCGCPVLASSGGALPEVVGDAGIVESEWTEAAWAGRIESLLSDRCTLDDLAARGTEREKQFTWEETARITLQAYREVADDRA
jgi:glycosyltransferase involved in cell wall biosynthesis